MSTHPSTAGLDDLSSSDWARESSSLVSILPGVTGDGQLWLVDTCSLSSGSDSEEGGWESRADRSINSSCHNLEKGQRDNVSSSASERETRDFKLKWLFFFFFERCDYLWEQRVRVFAWRGCAVVQETRETNKKEKGISYKLCEI